MPFLLAIYPFLIPTAPAVGATERSECAPTGRPLSFSTAPSRPPRFHSIGLSEPRPNAPWRTRTLCPSAPDHSPAPDESAANEIDDDPLVLSPDHVQRVVQFREAPRLCKTDTDKYELCLQTRSDLLKEASYITIAICLEI